MTNDNQELIKAGKWCFKYSLLFGTAIFLTHYISNFIEVAILGLLFLIAAIIINALTILALLVTLFDKDADVQKTIITAGIMLINIPIALLYLVFTTQH